VVLLGLGGYLIYSFGDAKLNEGTTTERAETSAQAVKEIKKYEKRKQENRQLDDMRLVMRYCRWVYGTSYDQCVSSYKFVDRE
jgi:hypothetical protein